MRRVLTGIAVVGLIALLPRAEAQPSGEVAFTPPAPETSPESSGEVGIASWYGEAFDGNPTANGETYDMNGFTAAHPSLPLGTKVRVTNLRNGRSMVLRVNDRGPYIAGRRIDVSKAAAYRLGFMASGLAMVDIKVVPRPKAQAPAEAPRPLPTGGD